MSDLTANPQLSEALSRCGTFATTEARNYLEASDKALLAWMCEGDTGAFDQIFRRYSPRIQAFASRYIESPDLAKDVCQEVFLKLIAKPPAVLLYDNLSPWLFRVARNLAIDKQRRRRFEVSSDEVMMDAHEEGTPLQTATANDDAGQVRNLVKGLSPELREVVELHVFGGMAFKDIAVTLNIPLGTALWRMHRALELLKLAWGKL